MDRVGSDWQCVWRKRGAQYDTPLGYLRSNNFDQLRNYVIQIERPQIGLFSVVQQIPQPKDDLARTLFVSNNI
jgi:hypothetical protein